MNEQVDKFKGRGTHALVREGNVGGLAAYQTVVIGKRSILALVKYELITCLFGYLPGSWGQALRNMFFPLLFAGCGKNVFFGRAMTIRYPGRIHLGDRITFQDFVTLDAKGTGEGGIWIEDDTHLENNVTISTVDGSIRIGQGTSIGSYTRVGSRTPTRIGSRVTMGSYCYLVASDHETSDLDTPIVDQPVFSRGGIEVGDESTLGDKATVLDAVKVGSRCVVDPESLVTENVPDDTRVSGVPAKVMN